MDENSDERLDLGERIAVRFPLPEAEVEALEAALGTEHAQRWSDLEEKINDLLDQRADASYDAGRAAGIAVGVVWAQTRDPEACELVERLVLLLVEAGGPEPERVALFQAALAAIEAIGPASS